MTARYRWILFDLDETLFDLPAHPALTAALAEFDRLLTPELWETYRRINQGCWQRYQQGQLTADELQRQRFSFIFSDLTMSKALNDRYLAHIVALSQPLEGVLTTLPLLAAHAKLGVITNGFSASQYGRLDKAGLRDYFDPIVVSDEVNTIKPQPLIFQEALRRMGNPDPAQVLMVGDNPVADIEGAAAVGMATCWYNPVQDTTPCPFTHHIHTFAELLPLVVE